MLVIVYKKLAVSNNFIEIVKFLISLSNVNPNLADKKGWSPLSIAVGNNYVDIVSILISNLRTNVNCKTVDEGATPLMIAILKNNFEIVKLLINDERTNINIRDYSNNTALSYAVFKKLSNVVDLLLKSEKFDPDESCLIKTEAVSVIKSILLQIAKSFNIKAEAVDAATLARTLPSLFKNPIVAFVIVVLILSLFKLRLLPLFLGSGMIMLCVASGLKTLSSN